MEDCVVENKLERLKDLIDVSGIDSFRRFDYIIMACQSPYGEEIANFLIESDPDEDSYTQHIRPGVKTPLHWACEKGWKDTVALCIRHGEDVNCRDSEQRTPLFYCRNPSEAELLLKNGARAEVRDEHGRTPLHCCEDGEIARMLLNNGAQVDVRDKRGSTPLHTCRYGNIAKVLLEYGAQVMLQDEDGRTPLHCVSYEGLVTTLIDNGASVDVRDKRGLTPLISSLISADSWSVGDLLKCLDNHGIEPDLCEYIYLKEWYDKCLDDKAFHALSQHAVRARANCGSSQLKMPFSARLISDSDQINRQDECGDTPLHFCENVAVAQLLLEKGALIDARNNSGQTPLHLCADLDLARLLLNHGASIDIKDSSGLTPLMRMLCKKSARDAASIGRCFALIDELGIKPDQSEHYSFMVEWLREDGYWEDLSELMKHGIDVQARSSSGQTILHHVVANRENMNEVEHLKDFGLDVNAVDNQGYSLLHALLHRYNLGSAVAANQWSFDYWEEKLAEMIYHMLDALLKHNTDMNVNIKDRHSDTALHMAIKTGRCDFAELLLYHRADPNIRDSSGRTPLILAAQASNMLSFHNLWKKRKDYEKEFLIHFLDHGADIFSRMSNGDTVFDYANCERQQIIIDYILTNLGRSPMVRVDLDGNTILHHICKSCSISSIDMLPLDSLDLDVVNDAGETPLLLASRAGKVRVVEFLLAKGASKLIAGRTYEGLTPVHIACVQRSIEELEFANIVAGQLEQGLDIDARDKLGKTPLHYAIENGCASRIKLLLDQGADASAADQIGKNSIYRAIESRKFDIVESILQSSTDATAHFFDGKTPLHLVTAWGDDDYLRQSISLLLEHSLDIDQLDANGDTPLFEAMSRDYHYRVIQSLLESGSNLDQLFWIDKKRALSLIGKYSYPKSRLLAIRLRAAGLFTKDDAVESGCSTNAISSASFEEGEISGSDNWPDYAKSCEQEVACLLKRRKIADQMTCYEFLHNHDPMIAKAICQGANRLPVDFPIYGGLIKGKIKMDLFRAESLESASDQLHSYLIESPLTKKLSIPVEIVRRILVHLSKRELIGFIRV